MLSFSPRLLQSTVFTSANGDRDDVANIALILTDGQSDDVAASFEVAAALHASDTATLITVGVDVRGRFARYS